MAGKGMAENGFKQNIRQYTMLIAWLNPMPQARWANSTAQMLAALAPMYQLNQDGFSRALDVARGQRF